MTPSLLERVADSARRERAERTLREIEARGIVTGGPVPKKVWDRTRPAQRGLYTATGLIDALGLRWTEIQTALGLAPRMIPAAAVLAVIEDEIRRRSGLAQPVAEAIADHPETEQTSESAVRKVWDLWRRPGQMVDDRTADAYLVAVGRHLSEAEALAAAMVSEAA